MWCKTPYNCSALWTQARVYIQAEEYHIDGEAHQSLLYKQAVLLISILYCTYVTQTHTLCVVILVQYSNTRL